MLDFRKTLLAAGIAAFALAGSAFGQGVASGTLTVPVTAWASIEGTTELVPELVIPLTGTIPSALSFTLTANVPYTNITPSTSSPALDVLAYDSNNDLGTVTLTSPTSVTVAFSTITGTPANIFIYGLRVNASVVPSPTITIAPGTLPAGGITFTSTTAVAALYPQPTLNTLTVTGFLNSPLGTFSNKVTGGAAAATIQPVVQVTVNTNEPGLLKSKANYTATYPVFVPVTGTEPTATAAAQGTRLGVTFTNLNANVNYWVPATIGDGVQVLTAYSAATGTTAASTTTFTSSAPTNGTTTANARSLSVTLVPLPTPVNGSATIYYGVTTSEAGAGTLGLVLPAADYFAPDAVATDLLVYETVPSTAAVTSVSSTGVGASVSLVGVSSGYPQFSPTAAPYTGTQIAGANNGLITLNFTTVLFPYVTNTGGYDTGIAITNASTLPTGVTSSIAASSSSATCLATFYGTGAPSTNPYSVGTVTTGTIATFDVGTVAPGFSGYVVVQCNFTGAHGYAFISNGLGTGNGVAANYLGIVINESGLFSIATDSGGIVAE
jgi:hypothetical protein